MKHSVKQNKSKRHIFLLSIIITIFALVEAKSQVKLQLYKTDRSDPSPRLFLNFQKFYYSPFLPSDKTTKHSIMLKPVSGAKYYPLFCKLEDNINEGNNIKCLFRLGSVEYVNYLEQKGDHQRLLLEQIR